jgi:hypothetical protein
MTFRQQLTKVRKLNKKNRRHIMGPITNYELGKMTHREYEAEASRYWGREVISEEKPGQRKINKLALALTGVILTAVLFVQLLPF